MNRREVTVEMALTLLGGATIVISGCGGGSPTASTPPLTDKLGNKESSGKGHTHTVSFNV